MTTRVRIGMRATIRLGGVVAVPTLVALRLCENPWPALILVALAGVAANMPFAVLVKLGQDYLPARPPAPPPESHSASR